MVLLIASLLLVEECWDAVPTIVVLPSALRSREQDLALKTKVADVMPSLLSPMLMLDIDMLLRYEPVGLGAMLRLTALC